MFTIPASMMINEFVLWQIEGTRTSQSLNPLNQARDMKKNIPKVELVIIENAGHAITNETPEIINEKIENFIKI